MQTTLRKIGNSRGVLIPAAFLASCHIEDLIDMQLQDGHIILKPVPVKLRDDWFTPTSGLAPDLQAAEQAEAVAWADVPNADESEWVW